MSEVRVSRLEMCFDKIIALEWVLEKLDILFDSMLFDKYVLVRDLQTNKEENWYMSNFELELTKHFLEGLYEVISY
jgi:hypothetical protein